MKLDQTTTIQKEVLAVDNKDISLNVERELLLKLKKKDETVFELIYKRWERPLFRFIMNIIGTRDVAEDICQETFVKLWLSCETIDPDKNIKTYLFLISKQLTLNYIRDRKRKNTFDYNPDIDDSDHLSPDIILEGRELELLMEYAISKLPPKTRKVFDLFYLDNLSYKQIATMLKMSPNNVAVQIHKARTKIEEEILLPS